MGNLSLAGLKGVCLDVETGGLDYYSNALLEVGMVVVKDGYEVAAWNWRINPGSGLAVDLEAARVNGYNAATWNGWGEREALTQIMDGIRWAQGALKRKKLTWIGANCPFDRSFMLAAMQRHGFAAEWHHSFDHRDVDVARIAWIPRWAGAVNGVGLDVLGRDLLGAEKRGDHNALEDVRLTLSCLQAIAGRLTWT